MPKKQKGTTYVVRRTLSCEAKENSSTKRRFKNFFFAVQLDLQWFKMLNVLNVAILALFSVDVPSCIESKPKASMVKVAKIRSKL